LEPWIVQMSRSRRLRQLMAWIAILLLGLLVMVFNPQYIRNFISGPFTVDAAELERILDPGEAQHYFAQVTGSEAVDTGVREVTTRNGREEGRTIFYALRVGGRWLVVKSSGDRPLTVEGELQRMTDQLSENIFSGPKSQEFQKQCYPFYMDTVASFRLPGYIFIGAVLLFFGLFAYYVPRTLRYYRDPSSDPVYARIASWGYALSLSQEIENEYRAPNSRRLGSWVLTDRYMIRSSFFTFNVLRFADLLWAYKKVTKRSVNFIPTGKTYESILMCYGGSAIIREKDKKVDETLHYAAQRAPWAVFGYSKEIEGHFRNHNRDFCASVEARKVELKKAVR
jgi:Family of unknown function (DUF6709)